MTDLYVDPDAVRHLGTEVGGYAADTSTAVTYHNNWCTITGGNGLFANFTSISADVHTAVDDALTHLRSILRSSSDGLDATADYYLETDAAVAAEMDRTYHA